MSDLIPSFSKMTVPSGLLNIDLPIHHIYSDTQFEIIKKHIKAFESSLDADHEVGVMLTNFGQSVLMYVTEISYEKSVTLVFRVMSTGKCQH